ncbi:MAG: type I restriction-modification system subunit M [Bacteroidales bacterium]|nr:type I restriction-modification system subunit M [Bacteroidales bacterium]
MKNTAQLAGVHGKLVSFIWGIADDVLRDVFLRGQYRDVILPMFVLRRLDALLEPTKEDVLMEITEEHEAGFADVDEDALSEITGLSYYNTSKWTLKRLLSEAKNDNNINHDNFVEYLNGYSSNVKDVLLAFDFYTKARKLADKDRLISLIQKYTDPHINLTNTEVKDPEGLSLPALTNIGMGYVFEELLRKFNEENNEEAGEHFTPREVIDLMCHLVFDPVKDNLPKIISLYDPAGGSGGMMTEATEYLTEPEYGINFPIEAISINLTELNPETYAICKSDLIIKNVDADGIVNGNTLDGNPHGNAHFGYMLTNPPYGKSWKTEAEHLFDGKELLDSRFEVELQDFAGEKKILDCTPRTSDGQLLFILDMISKMKSLSEQPQGSRIASIHNGSSLFTGDAGSGESNTRRYLIENDLVDAIIQLPNNIFYNTGITTYCWIITNKKEDKRKGHVMLIDASQCFQRLRKNLGEKNCEFSPRDVEMITGLYLKYRSKDADDASPLVAKIFDNDDFRFNHVIVERPLRLRSKFSEEAVQDLLYDKSQYDITKWMADEFGNSVERLSNEEIERVREHLSKEGIELTNKQFSSLVSPLKWQERKSLVKAGLQLMDLVGTDEYKDFNIFSEKVSKAAKSLREKLSAGQIKSIMMAVSFRDEDAKPVIKKVHKSNSSAITELINNYNVPIDKIADYGFIPHGHEYLEYESDSDIRDSENIPVKEDILAYFDREVRPYVADAWINLPKTVIGCEISFNKYFYHATPLRTLDENTAEILKLDSKSEGFINQLLGIQK